METESDSRTAEEGFVRQQTFQCRYHINCGPQSIEASKQDKGDKTIELEVSLLLCNSTLLQRLFETRTHFVQPTILTQKNRHQLLVHSFCVSNTLLLKPNPNSSDSLHLTPSSPLFSSSSSLLHASYSTNIRMILNIKTKSTT